MTTTEIDQLADRHLRPDPDGALAEMSVPRNGIVAIEIHDELATSPGIQHLAWMLVNTLARQFKIVGEIVLDVPPVDLKPRVSAFGSACSLKSALEQCIELVGASHIKVRTADRNETVDIALSIGCSYRAAAHRYYLHADGWRFGISIDPLDVAGAPTSELAIGPYMCASYASGEVFKILRGLKSGKGVLADRTFASLWSMSTAETWTELDCGVEIQDAAELGHFYLAGAGAVGQAAVACLGASGICPPCTAVEADRLDLSNDNRYVLATRSDEGIEKTKLVSRYLRQLGVQCTEAPIWWEDFVRNGGGFAGDPAIQKLEAQRRFHTVLSCVDKNLPRHAIQNALPQLIIGGSTYGLNAMASIFAAGSVHACLKCHNPVESREEAIRSRTELLRNASPAERSQLMNEWGLSPADVLELLHPSGQCGRLGEDDLNRFAGNSVDMSVGFVSVAAGVLLVAQWVRYKKAGPHHSGIATTTAMAQFLKPRVRQRVNGQDATCSCAAGGRRQWAAYWSDSGAQRVLG